MFEISLKINKSLSGDKNTTILDVVKKAGVVLEHSCLAARYRSCMVKMLKVIRLMYRKNWCSLNKKNINALFYSVMQNQ